MITCKDYVENRKKELKEKIEKYKSNGLKAPSLCVIQVGDNPASNSYINGKKTDCENVGIEFHHTKFDEYIGSHTLMNYITECSISDKYNGIIVQLPLPSHINVETVTDYIPANKDVDGFRRDSLFDPCTPKGIMDWLDYNKYDVTGKDVIVIGRSKIVGKPLVNMLIDKGATVTCCNSKTTDLAHYLSYADVVISAIGKPKYFDGLDFKCSDIIVDVGINRDENGKLCGDVDRESVKRVFDNTYVTPVPGGVGLLTRLALLDNVVKAYEIQNRI